MVDIQDVEQQFSNTTHSAGVTPPDQIIADGEIHRFSTNGKRGDKAGWYILFGDNIPAGAFGDWRTGISKTWRADIGRELTREEEATSRERMAEAQRRRDTDLAQRYAEAAKKAVYIWSKATSIISQSEHAYLVNKGIQPHGARLYRESLVIPLKNAEKKTVNLQFISPEGEKRFLSGGRKVGCFFPVGRKLTPRILICEGFATGASLYEDTGQCVIVAFDAGNLLPVARVIRATYLTNEIIVCGDNDESGVGQAKARDAALAIGGLVLIPKITGMDWNSFISGGRHDS